jgi:hypothetical protein
MIAHVAEPGGGMRRARVCGKCFSGAIHIVPAVTTVQAGVDETKLKRRESKEVLRGAITKLRKIAHTYARTADSAPDGQGDHANGRATGLEQAADLLEAGDF